MPNLIFRKDNTLLELYSPARKRGIQLLFREIMQMLLQTNSINSCALVTNGDTKNFSKNPALQHCNQYLNQGDVWYSFTATQKNYTIKMTDVAWFSLSAQS